MDKNPKKKENGMNIGDVEIYIFLVSMIIQLYIIIIRDMLYDDWCWDSFFFVEFNIGEILMMSYKYYLGKINCRVLNIFLIFKINYFIKKIYAL